MTLNKVLMNEIYSIICINFVFYFQLKKFKPVVFPFLLEKLLKIKLFMNIHFWWGRG